MHQVTLVVPAHRIIHTQKVLRTFYWLCVAQCYIRYDVCYKLLHSELICYSHYPSLLLELGSLLRLVLLELLRREKLPKEK